MSKRDETVKVVVRIRPLSTTEVQNGNEVAAEALVEKGLIVLKNPRSGEREPAKNFAFDAVFGPTVEQKFIYDVCASSVVESVLNGFNGTIFAYGQTGAGKTHTMEGRPDPVSLRGIIPNSFQHIFDFVGAAESLQFLVRASYLEIYNEEIRDLLSKDPKSHLDLKENVDSGVYVKDLTSFVVKNATEIDHVMQAGKKNRSVGATLMNQTSSRSHSIFTVVVECLESDVHGDHIRVGKLNLVDLAGSERQSKTGATGDRLKEATKINLSLAALGNVISALIDGKSSHVPYRDSKLTRLLQNSLGGNAKTVMCANAGPADYNYDETLSTLRYANRAKNIKNKPKVNEDPKDAMLREYQDEIKRLKMELEAANRGEVFNQDGHLVSIHDAKREIVEKIVEREVIKEVKVGISDAEMDALKKKSIEEKETLMKQAQEDMKALIEQQSATAQERAELEAALNREAEDRTRIEVQKQQLNAKLKQMEEKLIRGGEIMSKASKQEAMLRKAENELRERQMAENRMARELAEREEANIQLEEHFSSLQEEVEVKTRKLKKLFTKCQAATSEVKDLQNEFQIERADMLETIRQLTQNLKLKDLLIDNFIPEEYSHSLELRARWDTEADTWVTKNLKFSGRRFGNRPLSRLKTEDCAGTSSSNALGSGINHEQLISRSQGKNSTQVSFDSSEKTTQDFESPDMKSCVDNVLSMPLSQCVDVQNISSLKFINPYSHYDGDSTIDGGRVKTLGKKKSSRK